MEEAGYMEMAILLWFGALVLVFSGEIVQSRLWCLQNIAVFRCLCFGRWLCLPC